MPYRTRNAGSELHGTNWNTPQRDDSGGLVVCWAMRELLKIPAPIPVDTGGQLLRILYLHNANGFDPKLLPRFALHVFLGDIDNVKKVMEEGGAPSLTSTETPYQYGYAHLTVLGAQRVISGPPEVTIDHAGVLQLLLKCGAPPDLGDIVGYTALHQLSMGVLRADLARILLENGADPNCQDCFGVVPLLNACQKEYADLIDVLMEFGAGLDVPDADGVTPEEFYLKSGPIVTAVIHKWKRRRSGEIVALDGKGCTTCGKAVSSLKFCGCCHAARYCSTECQKTHWPTHKGKCIPFSSESTVTVNPFYEDIGTLVSTPDVMRALHGLHVGKQPARNGRSMHYPNLPPGETKKLIVKIQVPFDIHTGRPTVEEEGDMIVFDKKRSLVCRLRKQDDPHAYLRISRTIRAKGTQGAKAYFSAVLMTKDELVIKVSEVLAEQPF